MSNRRSVFQNENPNPATVFLEWKSKHQKFAYWDKEKQADILVDLPFKFLTLDILQTVKGFNDADQCGIYSNEVKRIGENPLTVKKFKGNQIIGEGIWKDIKGDVSVEGARYAQSIYAMTTDGSLINISLTGASLSAWFEFTEKTKSRLSDEWVTVTGVKQGKKGATVFYYPCFEFSGTLEDNETQYADVAFDTLEEYLKKYLKAPASSNDPILESDDRDILANGEREVNIDDFEQHLSNGGDPI